MKKLLRVFLALVPCLFLSVAGCGEAEKKPEVDTAAEPSADVNMPANPDAGNAKP